MCRIINNLIQQRRESFRKRRHARLQTEAEEKYQIKELDRQVWLTYNGNTILPQSMLKDDIVVVLNTIRKLYVERNE